VAQRAQRELGGIEILRVGPEAQARAGVLLADRADVVQRRGAEAVAEFHAPLQAVALDEHFHARGQGVHHADAHAVQAAGEGVVLVAELTARVQPRHDQFHAGDLLFRVDVHWHAAAVVGDLAAAVGMHGHLDRARVPGQRLVDRSCR
jgi:hypothetical protein